MAHDGQDLGFHLPVSSTIDNLLVKTRRAADELSGLFETARQLMKSQVVVDGKTSGKLLEDNQDAAHGLAWLATYATAMQQMQNWAEKLESDGEFGEIEQLLHQIGCSEYHAQVLGGIPMSQGEIIRLGDIGLPNSAIEKYRTEDVLELSGKGNNQEARMRLVQLMQDHSAEIITGKSGLDDELEMIREQFRKFSIDKVLPHAHEWHLNDDLIPMEIIEELAELGVFGLTIPEEYGGFGLSKASMAVVSEELSRGYIGVGSLGTRSEIAAELIECGGTEEQKQKWLPKIAMAETLPTAVFTEPNTGSDLGSLRTRATKNDEGDYSVTGNKTWITHASRTHVMTLLARTDPDSTDHRGLSMFLAEKIPGDDENPFPTEGMSGGEIEVLGYRGMKEYEIAFDNFEVKKDNLLGGEEGKGFRQLMKTFESARIQTAARAVGVAQQAIDLSFQYALDRK